MSSVSFTTARAEAAPPPPTVAATARLQSALLLAGVAAMFVPSWVRLASTTWGEPEHGHGPIVLLVGIWLAWRMRAVVVDAVPQPARVAGWSTLLAGVASYVLGRSQGIDTLECGALVLVLAALILIFRGWAALRAAWAPLVFLMFMVPLPGVWVIALTTPLKVAVSAVAEWLLHLVGYPVARSGVIIAVGHYRLLVADACAGLSSMFTLEAIGLLYVTAMGYRSGWRKALIALVSIPIAFVANVCRVLILALVTWYFGEAAGMGFLHSAAGIVMFVIATLMLVGFDDLLRRAVPTGPFAERERL